MPASTVTKRGAASLQQGPMAGFGLAARRPARSPAPGSPAFPILLRARRAVEDSGSSLIYCTHFPNPDGEYGLGFGCRASGNPQPGPELGEDCGVGAAAAAGVASAPGGCAARPRRDLLFVS